MSSAEQANADFYYNLPDSTAFEAVGEDDLDAHMQAPVFGDLVTDEAIAPAKPEPAPERMTMTGWDRFWCALWITMYLGVLLGSFAAWMVRS
ncbi:hypothetical protein [Rhodococcus jostii]|uniref:hypothetical protein n=1 Tax=Rhodococcus jostii TaxID=132919 RepID=UPI00362EDBE8